LVDYRRVFKKTNGQRKENVHLAISSLI